MSHYEHAQQIYAHLLAARMSSGQAMPLGQELENFAKGAMIYAMTFAKVVPTVKVDG
jgi:hypothetical protein